MTATADVLWTPSPERIERAAVTQFARARGLPEDYDALWRWSVEHLEDFWAAIWEHFGVDGGYDEVLATRDMPGAALVPRRAGQLRRAPLPRQAGRPRRDPPRLRAAPRRRVDVGRPAARDRADPCGAAGARRRARRPRRRLHAEHPGDDRGLPGHHVARRDLVVGGAGVRRAQRRRPLRPDRAEGPARRRRLPLRRPRLRPLRAGRGHRGAGRHRRRAARLRRRLGLGGRVPGRRPARVRARAVRPPALDPLLVGDDGPAEADRPRAGRHPARAPQEDAPAPRRAGRRPRLLVHDDRLDDVELPGRRAAHRRVGRALRRQPRGRGALGPRRRHRHHDVRHRARRSSPGR